MFKAIRLAYLGFFLIQWGDDTESKTKIILGKKMKMRIDFT